MSELQTLTAQRDEVLAKIREIEVSCEGIENEHNAQRVQELNLEQAQLNAQKQELSAKLSAMNSRLSAISSEIASLSGTGIDRILEAIKNQRWYFFKNKPKVLMDKNTGLLWNNPEYIPFRKKDGNFYTVSEAIEIARNMEEDGIRNWMIVTRLEFEKISYIGTDYPFYTGSCHEIDNSGAIIMDSLSREDYTGISCYNDKGVFLIFSRDLVRNSDYEKNVSLDNHNYNERERLQFTLDLFVKNDLLPVFDDEELRNCTGRYTTKSRNSWSSCRNCRMKSETCKQLCSCPPNLITRLCLKNTM